ncbi:putative gas vesicle structural protein 1 [Streptomyces litmocidini]|uniref:gas vesicle structural protein GvpA n=1 Tax=Streptomyces litmocidini TaxID=67318 RepID=UPI00167D6840|nr:gas vesicle structural protein GvpA [Streptomyces litmocidini]GGU81384.1 putative gas vesicle structural protein 1 [Streptomyces litmocidini]
MTVMPQGASGSPARGGQGGTGSLYDVLELILDRGLVIDAFVRVSLVGIEILKIDVRVVVASVDTYLRFAEACNRLDLESGRKAPTQLPEMMDKMVEGGSKGKTKGALSGAMEAVTQSLSGREDEDDDEGDEEEQEAPRRRKPARRTARRERE